MINITKIDASGDEISPVNDWHTVTNGIEDQTINVENNNNQSTSTNSRRRKIKKEPAYKPCLQPVYYTPPETLIPRNSYNNYITKGKDIEEELDAKSIFLIFIHS